MRLMASWCLWLLPCLLASSASAQAAQSQLVEQYRQSIQLGTGKTKAPRSEDARLNTAFAEKISSCYQQEVNEPINESQRTLLRQYTPELVVQFAAPLRQVGCELNGKASEECLAKLAQLDCAHLATVIREHGWDRAPSKAMEAAIARYAERLVGRYFSCRAGPELDSEETSVREDYMVKSVSVQISLLLTTGQCSLDEKLLQDCIFDIAASDACAKLLDLSAHSRLPRFCTALLDCSNEPALVGNVVN